jgi:hypothetical protein
VRQFGAFIVLFTVYFFRAAARPLLMEFFDGFHLVSSLFLAPFSDRALPVSILPQKKC